jgi:hypothetical protein
MVDRLTLTVELATKHLSGDGHLEHVASELAMSVRVVDVGSALKDLDDGLPSGDFKDLALSGLPVAELHVDNFGVPGELDVVKDDEGSLDIEDCAVVYTGCDVVVAYSK